VVPPPVRVVAGLRLAVQFPLYAVVSFLRFSQTLLSFLLAVSDGRGYAVVVLHKFLRLPSTFLEFTSRSYSLPCGDSSEFLIGNFFQSPFRTRLDDVFPCLSALF